MNDNPPRVLLRSEQSGGQVAVVELTGAGRPPLHRHDFDEAFYVLEGELAFQAAKPIPPVITLGPPLGGDPT